MSFRHQIHLILSIILCSHGVLPILFRQAIVSHADAVSVTKMALLNHDTNTVFRVGLIGESFGEQLLLRMYLS
jgi:hypothetical protein